MSDTLVIKPIAVTPEEQAAIKTQKYAYINQLNYSGTFYNPIRFVSAVLNNMIEHLNQTEPLEIPIGGFYAHSFDMDKIRSYSVAFFDNLKQGGVRDEVINYIKELFEETLSELVLMTAKAQKEFEDQQAAKGE